MVEVTRDLRVSRIHVTGPKGIPILLVTMVAACGVAAPPASTTTTAPTASCTTTSTVPTTSTIPPATTTSVPVTSTTAAPTTTTTRPPTTATTPVAPAAVVTRIPTDERMVALTFDAGADRGYAAEILDTLAAHGIGASFAITGQWAERNPDLVRRMADEGHTIINHTYDHPHMELLTTAERLQQLARGEQVIVGITGKTTRPCFRFPYGSYDRQSLVDLAAAGYRHSIMWTVDTLGWKGVSTGEIVARCQDALQPGVIILMHVGAASTDGAALETVIHLIDQAGYRYATIAELLP